ncbi:MAG: phosphatase PAP2 family protein [Fimbriimonadaceae bacterium]
MLDFWKLDLYWFRVVHEGAGSAWAAPVFKFLSDSGLGHVALAALVAVVAWRKWPSWAAIAWSVAWLVAVVVSERDIVAVLACAGMLALFRSVSTRTLLIGLVAAIVASLVRLLVEPTFDRLRPSNLEFARPMEEVYGASSFPSGHSTLVAALVVAMLLVGTGKRGATWLFALWAVLVGLSRIAVGVHFPSDVLGGFALGASVAALVVMMWPEP